MAIVNQRLIKTESQPISRLQYWWRIVRILAFVIGVLLATIYFPVQALLICVIFLVIDHYLSAKKEKKSVDTTDWDAETERVTRAFNITEPCSFIKSGRAIGMLPDSNFVIAYLKKSAVGERPDWFRYGNMHLTIHFGTNGYGFKFMRGRFEKSPLGIATLYLHIPVGELAETNSPSVDHFDHFTPEELLHVAKGVFRLGLLDAKVEEALGIVVSEQQKVDWITEKN